MSIQGRQKIIKAAGVEPDELELQVASELFNLEVIVISQLIKVRKDSSIIF